MKRLIMALTVAAIGLAYSGTARAVNVTGTMNVSATVLVACTVSTTPLDLGIVPVQGLSPSSTSAITVNCPNGVPYYIDIDAGQNYFSDGIRRYVKTGTAPADFTNTTSYYLYQDSVHTTYWGDNGVTYCLTCATPLPGKLGSGIGVAEVHTVYATVAAASLPAGTYTDMVVVTVQY